MFSFRDDAKIPGVSPVLDSTAIAIAEGYVQWTYAKYYELLMYKDFRDDPNHPMKSIPLHSTTPELPKKQTYKRGPKPKATNHGHGEGHGFDLLIQQVIDEDWTRKCASNNNKQGIKHKVTQKCNLTAMQVIATHKMIRAEILTVVPITTEEKTKVKQGQSK